MVSQDTAQEVLDCAVEAIANDSGWRAVLDGLPAPVYVTDVDGAVTYWNRACVELAGREPQLGHDRWCVTWQIYSTAGQRIPHDQCPMAEAIRTRKSVRGSVAIALRPDGRRIAFQPYPTPLFDKDGTFTGAVNLLIDVTEQQQPKLCEEASRCRRIAEVMYDRSTREMLSTMAAGFEKTAQDLGGTPA